MKSQYHYPYQADAEDCKHHPFLVIYNIIHEALLILFNRRLRFSDCLSCFFLVVNTG